LILFCGFCFCGLLWLVAFAWGVFDCGSVWFEITEQQHLSTTDVGGDTITMPISLVLRPIAVSSNAAATCQQRIATVREPSAFLRQVTRAQQNSS
jgi:hypothetical protein